MLLASFGNIFSFWEKAIGACSIFAHIWQTKGPSGTFNSHHKPIVRCSFRSSFQLHFFRRRLSFCFIIILDSFRLRNSLNSTSLVSCYRHFVWPNSGAMTNIKMKTTEKKIIFLFRVRVVQPRILFVWEWAKCVSNEYANWSSVCRTSFSGALNHNKSPTKSGLKRRWTKSKSLSIIIIVIRPCQTLGQLTNWMLLEL